MMGDVVNFALRTDRRALAVTQPESGAGQVIEISSPNETPAMRFDRAYHAAAIARAAFDLHRARYFAWLRFDKAPGQPWQESPYASQSPFEEMRALIFRLAVTPAQCRVDLEAKKALIGRVWLKAEGEFYDALRAGVEVDELRFPKRRRSRS